MSVAVYLHQQAGTDDLPPTFGGPRMFPKALWALTRNVLDLGCNFKDVQLGLKFSTNQQPKLDRNEC